MATKWKKTLNLPYRTDYMHTKSRKLIIVLQKSKRSNAGDPNRVIFFNQWSVTVRNPKTPFKATSLGKNFRTKMSAIKKAKSYMRSRPKG